MTEWRTFGDGPADRPEDGEKVLICYAIGKNEKGYLYTCYRDDLGLLILYWMPIPRTPDAKPRPKFEVPKDGKAYLCWSEKHGHLLVQWIKVHSEYTYLGGLYDSSSNFVDTITRYMDRNGNWVKRDAQ